MALRTVELLAHGGTLPSDAPVHAWAGVATDGDHLLIGAHLGAEKKRHHSLTMPATDRTVQTILMFGGWTLSLVSTGFATNTTSLTALAQTIRTLRGTFCPEGFVAGVLAPRRFRSISLAGQPNQAMLLVGSCDDRAPLPIPVPFKRPRMLTEPSNYDNLIIGRVGRMLFLGQRGSSRAFMISETVFAAKMATNSLVDSDWREVLLSGGKLISFVRTLQPGIALLQMEGGVYTINSDAPECWKVSARPIQGSIDFASLYTDWDLVGATTLAADCDRNPHTILLRHVEVIGDHQKIDHRVLSLRELGCGNLALSILGLAHLDWRRERGMPIDLAW